MNKNFGPVQLVHKTGARVTYPSVLEFARAVGARWIEANLTDRFEAESDGVAKPAWSLTSEEGLVPLAMRELLTWLNLDSMDIWGYWPRNYRCLTHDHSGEPVRHAGRRTTGSYFRRIRGLNAKKQAQVMEEGEPAPRASRSFKLLPNSWDDYPVSSRWDRSWKKFRKTQYK